MNEDTVERLRAEFVEMPGLCLTRDQVRRFCGVNERIVQTVLDALVGAKFLRVRQDGSYVRLTEGPSTPARPVGVESTSSSAAGTDGSELDISHVNPVTRLFKWSAVVAGAAIGGTVLARTIPAARARLRPTPGRAAAVDHAREALEGTRAL